jgi:cytoskeletal protein CcmA (bactofilin family)
MKRIKKLLVTTMLTVVTNVQAAPLLDVELNNQSIYAGSYVTTGDAAKAAGNLQAFDAITIGASSQVGGTLETGTFVSIGAAAGVAGNIKSGTYVSVGDSAVLGGDVQSGTYTSIGEAAGVVGNINAGGAVTIADNATVVGDVVSKVSIAVTGKGAIDGDNTIAIDDGTSSPHVVVSQESNITNAQQTLRELEGTDLNGTVTTNIELFPGVYNVNGILAVTGGIIITLNGKNKDSYWVFNISQNMTFGDGAMVNLIDVPPDSSVIWNVTGGYATIGANANMRGLILAKGNITSGDSAKLSGVGDYCGGAFSAKEYITLGASSSFGTKDCLNGAATSYDNLVRRSSMIAISEPATFLLLGMGFLGFLGLIGINNRRKA